jgi:5-methylcytosine-specific restriction endonuclease McrA
LTRFTVTLDHVKSIADGGDHSFDNLVTACLLCNSRKNARLLGDFMAESKPGPDREGETVMAVLAGSGQDETESTS